MYESRCALSTAGAAECEHADGQWAQHRDSQCQLSLWFRPQAKWQQVTTHALVMLLEGPVGIYPTAEVEVVTQSSVHRIGTSDTSHVTHIKQVIKLSGRRLNLPQLWETAQGKN